MRTNPATPFSFWNMCVASTRLEEYYATLCLCCLENTTLCISDPSFLGPKPASAWLDSDGTMQFLSGRKVSTSKTFVNSVAIVTEIRVYTFSVHGYLGDRGHEKQVRRKSSGC